MHVDMNPGPPELECSHMPEEIAKALRISANAAGLVSTILVGPVMKPIRDAVAGDDWKPEDNEMLPPRVCDQIVAGCFRLSESFERQRQECMDSHVADFKRRGGEWPKKPEPVIGGGLAQAVSEPMLSRIPMAFPGNADASSSEMAQAMREELPSPMLRRLESMTDELKVLALETNAKLYGVEVHITRLSSTMTERDKATAVARLGEKLGLDDCEVRFTTKTERVDPGEVAIAALVRRGFGHWGFMPVEDRLRLAEGIVPAGKDLTRSLDEILRELDLEKCEQLVKAIEEDAAEFERWKEERWKE